ncbi:MAG: isochorismatase family protein [Clostridium sp.]|nr:isochorismatase family protein [Clostridium sp.]
MKLLVIDIQKGITDSRLFNFDEFIENTTRIIQAARDNQIEVIYFQHDDGPGTGFSIGDEDFEIAEQVIPKEGEKIFIKNINSCFGNKDFTDYVKDDNTLVIVGLQTNFSRHKRLCRGYVFCTIWIYHYVRMVSHNDNRNDSASKK